MITKAPGSKAPSGHMNHYLEVLGLKPGATMDEVNTTYFTIIKRIPENPTEEEQARIQELKRAYDMLRRAYQPPSKKAIQVLFDRRHIVPIGGVLAAIMVFVLVAMNYGTIKTKLVHHEPGVVLRIDNQTEPYGDVVGYESQHRFGVGNPSPAYAIRLKRGGDTIWVSERLVVNGMARVSSR